MREVNFSVPSSNKAAVSITAALYDRRALDCTSTLPLINSLNHLLYLTTSSARIREILTVDGGIEKLICILKNGRSKEMMDAWKWNLAFQCVVNIGVRGSDGRNSDNRSSENIRTRVVEADVVPVVATILSNYMQVVERLRAHSDERRGHGHSSRAPEGALGERRSRRRGDSRRRENRHDGANSAAPVGEEQLPADSESDAMDNGAGNSESENALAMSDVQPSGGDSSLLRPPPRQSRTQRHAQRRNGGGDGDNNNNNNNNEDDDDNDNDNAHDASPSRLHIPRAQSSRSRTRASTWAASGDSSPVHERDLSFPLQQRLTANSSSSRQQQQPQPDTPTTPNAPGEPSASATSSRRTSASPAGHRRLSIRRQTSGPEGLPDHGATEMLVEERPREEPRIENEVDMTDLPENIALETAQTENAFTPNIAGNSDVVADGFELPGAMDSIMDPSATPTQRTLPFAGNATDQFAPTIVAPSPEVPPPGLFSRGPTRERSTSSNILASVPRDEDIIHSLQLLAYISKYCPLRPYFQQTHLVPKLKIGRELQQIDGVAEVAATARAAAAGEADHDDDDDDDDDDNDDEYCQPDDYNIFPLVEKFTMRHHSQEMRQWAGVVMRNLCRKDKARGDIRQCAYYKCGRWEEFARQFAKCRRCRQTKYCSKECQKSAWVAHRHWCVQCTSSAAAPEAG